MLRVVLCAEGRLLRWDRQLRHASLEGTTATCSLEEQEDCPAGDDTVLSRAEGPHEAMNRRILVMGFSKGPKINNYTHSFLSQVVDLGFGLEEQGDGESWPLSWLLAALAWCLVLCFWKRVLITVVWGCSV